MDPRREEFYSLLMDGNTGEEVHRLASIIEDSARQAIETERSDERAQRLSEHMIRVARGMLEQDMEPIRDLAAFMLKEDISVSQVGKMMFRILDTLPDVDERDRIFLEKLAFVFVVILSSEINEMFYRAAQRATGISDELFRRFVKNYLKGKG